MSEFDRGNSDGKTAMRVEMAGMEWLLLPDREVCIA